MNNSVCELTDTVGCEVVYVVSNYVRRPTDSEYGSDSYPHQSDSLAHSQDALCIERDMNPI